MASFSSASFSVDAFSGEAFFIDFDPSKGGFVGRKPRRYVVEIDGEYFDVRDQADAAELLRSVRESVDDSANRDVQTGVIPKPPRVGVSADDSVISKALKDDVLQTQRAINAAYREAAKRRDAELAKARARFERELAKKRSADAVQYKEISDLLTKKIDEEDEIDVINALILMLNVD